MTLRPVVGDDVRSLRESLLAQLRSVGAIPPVPVTAPEHLVRLTTGLRAAEVRVGLAWVASLSLTGAQLTPADVGLWIDTAGLRGRRVSVRDGASGLGVSVRQAHRRIRAIDGVVARALNSTRPGDFRRLARSIGGASSALDQVELIELARADSYLTESPARATDALTMYLRNRGGRRGGALIRPRYADSNKDLRYRDAGRVNTWLQTLAADPPVSPTSDVFGSVLIQVENAELATDPHDALAQVGCAISRRDRQILPLLLSHAGSLIPSASAVGTETWLGYLQLCFHAAMEAEHIVALRFARALQADAARLSRHGIADPQVRRGMSGCGQILQMFGHYDAAIACYGRAARHGSHFPSVTSDERQVTHDIYAQIVYTESLRQGSHADTEKAIRRMNEYADRHPGQIEIQFTRQRRLLEARLRVAARRDELLLAAPSRRYESAVEDEYREFMKLTERHSSPNRALAGQDITLLYAILTRDMRLAVTARDNFQRIVEAAGAYANLSDRFNHRLDVAATLSAEFRAIAPVAELVDPLRRRDAIPTKPTGFLVTPTVFRQRRSPTRTKGAQ